MHFLFLFVHIVILDHLLICFSMFYPPPVSCICFWSLTCVRQKPPNSKKGRRKYAMSSVHPPKTAIVLKEVHKECAPLGHVCMCTSIVCLSVYLWVSLVSNLAIAGHSHSLLLLILSPTQASHLWWIGTPAGPINLQFPLHNQSWQSKVEGLCNIKLSETSYKGSF